MLNCISQDSAAGTGGREDREYKTHKTCVPSQKVYKQLKITEIWMLSYVL